MLTEIFNAIPILFGFLHLFPQKKETKNIIPEIVVLGIHALNTAFSHQFIFVGFVRVESIFSLRPNLYHDSAAPKAR